MMSRICSCHGEWNITILDSHEFTSPAEQPRRSSGYHYVSLPSDVSSQQPRQPEVTGSFFFWGLLTYMVSWILVNKYDLQSNNQYFMTRDIGLFFMAQAISIFGSAEMKKELPELQNNHVWLFARLHKSRQKIQKIHDQS